MRVGFVGPGKLGVDISVILPTRGRNELAVRCLRSYEATCDAPVEFVVKVDDSEPAPDYPAVVVRSPKGRGYADVGKYYGEMAAAASGRWLVLTCDDFEMKTDGWDTYIRNIRVPPHGIAAVKMKIGSSLFSIMAITKQTWRVLGRVSPIVHFDSYLNELFGKLKLPIHYAPITVEHDQSPGLSHQSDFVEIPPEDLIESAEMESFKRDVLVLEGYLHHGRYGREPKRQLVEA